MVAGVHAQRGGARSLRTAGALGVKALGVAAAVVAVAAIAAFGIGERAIALLLPTRARLVELFGG